MKKKCYVDCTNTVYKNPNTGIQRVVRNIIERCPAIVDDIEFLPVFAAQGKFYHLPQDCRCPVSFTIFIDRYLGVIRNALDWLFGLRGTTTSTGGGEPRQKQDFHSGIIIAARHILPMVLAIPLKFDVLRHKLIVLSLNPGDIFFSADVFWNSVFLDALKKLPPVTTNILLVYDISPILYPQFHNQHVDAFVEHYPFICRWADGIFSISSASLEEIREYHAREGILTAYYDYFHLGADFGRSCITGTVQPRFVKLFSGVPAFLMVGTIEPRKNHLYVLEAFSALWERGVDVKLCIVGRIGWKCDDVLAVYESSPEKGRRLFMIHDASDAELSYCYDHASATIISSHTEGFGLPLVEALQYGGAVFASDIPVFREIGGDSPLYFTLNTSDDLVEKIVSFLNDVRPIVNHRPVFMNWDDSVASLLTKIVAMVKLLKVS